MYRPRLPGSFAGSKHPTLHASRQPACASEQASELSADGVLQHLLVQAEIGDYLPQLRVLILELLQPAHLGRQQSVVLLLPIEVVAWLIPALRQISAPPASHPCPASK